MGSANSGRWYRYSKTTVERCLRLEIRNFKSLEIDSGDSFPLSLNNGITQHIEITKTPCNYGGFRKWFVCPNCHSRCAFLYNKHSFFCCRKCNNLAYSSQNKNLIDRLTTKKRSLENKLYGNERKRWRRSTIDVMNAELAHIENHLESALRQRLFG